MFRYETHLHTAPVSKCAKATVEQTLRFYHRLGYDGVFITNHFLDGNLNIDRSLPYEERLAFYCSDYEAALALAPEVGIKVFFGVELSNGGTDFLIYGLPPAWYFAHPGIMEMKKSEELAFMRSEGALVIQAHPFREAAYIDHIRLYPRQIDGVEIINAGRKDDENRLAAIYARAYGLLETAGSDNHSAGAAPRLCGVETEEPICSPEDYIRLLRAGKTQIFDQRRDPDPVL